MSVAPRAGSGKITVPDILSRKSSSPIEQKQKISCLTAYDYPTARLLDEAGVEVLAGGGLGRHGRARLRQHVAGHASTTFCTTLARCGAELVGRCW